MRDDEIDSMTAEEFKRRYEGTHEEIKVQSMLKGDKYGSRPNNIKHPESRNINANPMVPIPGKSELEKRGIEIQHQKTRSLIHDAIDVRNKEVLDPEQVPMTKLLDLAVKMMPMKLEGEVEHKVSYGDMIMKIAARRKKAEVVEEAEFEE